MDNGTDNQFQTDHRSGRYVVQPGGYKAFDPAPLPPDPPINIDGEMWHLLSDADRAIGRLDGVAQILPDTDIFLMMYVRKEALYSSQIEGTQASLDDIIAYEENIKQAENPDDVEEVINYVDAINHGVARLSELPVSLRLIREIHGKLMQGVRGQHKYPGEFRTTQNWVGASGATIDTAAFVPPPPNDLMRHLDQLEKFIHTKPELPTLFQIGMIHAQFETIHPFLDGNGRLGRLLITFLLCEKEILRQPSLYISHYFKRYRSEYYSRLQNIRDNGDWENWLKFFLRGVREVAREGANTARAIVELREQHRIILSEYLSHAHAGSAFKILDYLYQTPVLSVNRAAEIIERSYANARAVVMELVQLNLLEEITGKDRGRRYRYSPYVDIFRSATD